MTTNDSDNVTLLPPDPEFTRQLVTTLGIYAESTRTMEDEITAALTHPLLRQELARRVNALLDVFSAISSEIEYHLAVRSYRPYFCSAGPTLFHQHAVTITGRNEYEGREEETIWCVESDFDTELVDEWVLIETGIVGLYTAESDCWLHDGYVHEEVREPAVAS